MASRFMVAALVLLGLLGDLSSGVFGQNTINTIAGGGAVGGAAAFADIPLATGVVIDKSGNLYVASFGESQVYKVDTSGQLSVAAGETFNFSGDGGPATDAALSSPDRVAVDSSGNLFIADTFNNRIRRVDASTQIITTVAGNGTAGFSGDGGPATSAELNSPEGVAVDSSGNLFIADTFNNRIRRVDASTQIITTAAGNGTFGFSGDGGPATSAALFGPSAVAVDSSGHLFIADTSNSRIRRVDASTQIITTVAGNGTAGFSGDGGPATSAELNFPEGVAVDSSDNLFMADTYNQRIRRVAASTQIITTVAGNGTAGFSGDGGPATSAELNFPEGVAVGSSENLFIADAFNNRVRRVDAVGGMITTYAGGGSGGDGGPATDAIIAQLGVTVDATGDVFIADAVNERIRRVDASTQIITTVAGNGTGGFSGDGGPATSATLFEPLAAVDSSGNLFIADSDNYRIRRVDASAQIITTVAGNSTVGFSGDGGTATNAELGLVPGVAVDSSGNLFIADTDNQCIRRVDASTQIITTVAGNGTFGFSGDGGPATSAELDLPDGVAVDGSGNLFIADTLNNRIRRVDASTQIITTVAGNGTAGLSGDGGSAISAELNFPGGVAVDSSGTLFIADTYNQRIRRVDASTQIIATVAGNGTAGFSGDGGSAISAEIHFPEGVGVDSSGTLFISDGGNSRIRSVALSPTVSLSASSLTFATQLVGTRSAAQTATLTNTGGASLALTSIAASGDFTETNTCGTSVAPDTSCTISVTFKPRAAGARTGTVTITDNATGSPQTIALTGTGTVVMLSAAKLNFGSVPVGATSSPKSVTLRNVGSATLTINSIRITGANAGDFAQTNTCGTSVTAHASCTITVTFKPTAKGARSASVSISDNGGGSPQKVTLSGTGTWGARSQERRLEKTP